MHLASAVTACGLSSWAAGLQSTGSVLVVLGFTCSVVSVPCGIFPDQGSTCGLQHGQSSSSSLSHWGSPSLVSIADRSSSLPGTAISRTGAEHADVTYLASLQVFSDHFVPLWSTGLGGTLLWFLCGPTRCPKMEVYQVLSGLKAVCQGLLSEVLFFIRNA